MHNPSEIKQIYKCRDCTYSINCPSNLRKHEKVMHNPFITGTIEYHCTIDVTALKNEIVMRGNEYQRKLESPSEIKQMYKCQDCPFSTIWLSNLRSHEKFMHNPSEIKKIYECQDCTYSTNWSSNLRRHEKFKHNPLVTGTIEYHCTIDVAALKNEIVQGDNEYQNKLELGREIKKIVQELNVPIASLDKEKMDALQLFESHGQVKHDEWRPWL